MWLIITEHTLITVETDTKKYHTHTLTGAEIHNIYMVNPSRIHALLAQWYAGQKLKKISLAFAGSIILEAATPTPKTQSGYITHTHAIKNGTYSASIPGALLLQYHCIFTSLGITIQTITTGALLAYAATESLEYDTQILIQGCNAYESI